MYASKKRGMLCSVMNPMTTASQKCNNISQICNKSLVIVENTTDKISSTNRNRIKAWTEEDNKNVYKPL